MCVWASLGVGGLSVACGPPTEAKAPVVEALRAEADRILAMRAPRYSGTGEKADALRFVKSDFSAWIAQRKAATDALVRRYEAARSGAGKGPGVAVLYGDVAELVLDFCREFVAAAAASTPRELRADAKLYESIVGALIAAVIPQLERATVEAETCIATAQPTETAAVVRCKKTKDDAVLLRGRATTPIQGLDAAIRL